MIDTPNPVFVYDGDCAFCTSCARFIERWIPTRARVIPWQLADLDALGLTREQCVEAVQWVGADRRVAAGPDAIALLLRHGGRMWPMLGRLMQVSLVRAVAWPAYRWVARNRHRLPGGTAACAVPAPAAAPTSAADADAHPDDPGKVQPDLR